MNETELTAAAVRMYADADAVLAVLATKVAEMDVKAAAIKADRTVIEAAIAQIAAATGPANGTVLAAEGGNFTVSGASRVVRFGAGTGWRTATLPPGNYVCRLSTFNSTQDPAEGQVKSCLSGPYQG